MKAEEYAKEVEYLQYQYDHRTINPVTFLTRLELLTIAYRSAGNPVYWKDPDDE